MKKKQTNKDRSSKRSDKSPKGKSSSKLQLRGLNQGLQRANASLTKSNKDITRKGIVDRASFEKRLKDDAKTARDIYDHSENKNETHELQKRKLRATVKRGSKSAKINKAKLRRRDEEIETLNKELQTYTFISSHDLQEPLRNLQLITSILIEREGKNLSEAGKGYLKKLEGSAKKIRKLIQDLVEYANTNKTVFKAEKTDLNKILADVKISMSDFIKENHAHISSSNLPTAKVVAFQFEKLFTELITNAIKFSKPGVNPEITISSEVVNSLRKGQKKNSFYNIRIRDNGFGFEPQFKEKVFEVFQKLNDKAHPGSGIGLATCKKIVENHDGKIIAESEFGTGTTIHLFIPAH